jgi:hypothetical protein
MNKEWKEVKENVVVLTIRSRGSRSTWPRRYCVLPVDIAVDRRAYSRVTLKYHKSSRKTRKRTVE